MAKINVYNLKRKKKEEYAFKITDEANPGVEVLITIREPDFPTIIEVNELQEQYSEMFFNNGTKFTIPPIQDEEGGHFIPEIKKELLQVACVIYCLQVGPEEELYSVEEILTLIHTMESGSLALISKVNELATKFGDLIENPMGAVILPHSQSIPESTADTQNLTTE